MKISRLMIVLLLVAGLFACKPPSAPIAPPDAVEESADEVQADSPAEPEPSQPEGNMIMVTSTEDSGPGTLRQALQDIQDYGMIIFDPAVFPPDAPAAIFISSELPHIRANHLSIDASNAGVILDGSQVPGDWTAGLQIVSSEGNTIMGLQVSHFPGPGIALSGTATNNVIGGDRGVGAGPWGQGNLVSQNVIGIDLTGDGTKHNIITGNLIGIDLVGSDWLGNHRNGVSIGEGANNNTIGPNNIIAANVEGGVYIAPSVSTQNTITGNDIFDNGVRRGDPAYPALFDFDISAGTATGATCPNCTVELFSTSSYEGEILEGQTTADEKGVFDLDKGEPFTGPFLTVRTTNGHDRTSFFSWPPTSGTEQRLVLQGGNNLPRTQFFSQLSSDLLDNHIATQYDGIAYIEDFSDRMIYSQGVTRARVSMVGLEPELVDWAKPEFSISQAQQDHFTRMADEDIIVTYVLIYWDKENYPDGDGLPCYRFTTEEEIERWLEYVRFIVENLKDRVQYFEIWNEPDIANYCPKSIYLPDYINLIKRTAPVIREVAPEAKIVVGAVSGTAYSDAYNYLLGVVRSDAMPLVDVISWHPMYGFSPELSQFSNYYYAYPDTVQEIKDTAAASGFVGEYHVDELTWRTAAKADQPGVFTQVGANKYFLQSAIMHRGMGIDIGLGSGYYIIRRLSTVLAGVEPVDLPVVIESTATDILSYTFSTPDGGSMVGLWRHNQTSEFDPGVESALAIPDTTASRVVVIDPLYNLEQELNFEIVNGDLVISSLMVKDYPILIRIEN